MIIVIAMASSSSLNMCSSNGVMGTCNVSKSQKFSMNCFRNFSQNLVTGMPICSSSEFAPLRCSLGVKPFKWESNRETLTKFGVPCNVIGVKNSNSFSIGQKFELTMCLKLNSLIETHLVPYLK